MSTFRGSIHLAVFCLLAACGSSPPADSDSALATAVAQTVEALDATRSAVPSATLPPSPTPVPPTEAPSPEPSATIAHLVRPQAPVSVQRFLTDASSAAYAAERRALAEDFDMNRFERPFTTSEMIYQPHLDLVRAELDARAPWFYVTLFLEALPPAGAAATYGVELDVNADGRGDWLILAHSTLPSDWSTDGVAVYRDANGDVGGARPLRADPQPQPVDGYETLVFDQGRGEDPDAAWVRLAPGGARIQIAFKQSLIPGESFLWSVLAQSGEFHPEWADYNDRFSLDEAGSPLKNSPAYPVKDLQGLDSTCRDAYGIATGGSEPGLCVLPAAAGGIVWKDRCLVTGGEGGEPLVLGMGCVQYGAAPDEWGADAIYEPSWEPGIAGVTVDLGSGACPSSGLATATSDSAGRYAFSGLTAGTYCVSINVFAYGNEAKLIPGGWTFPVRAGPARHTLTLLAGESRSGLNFGWMFQFGD